MIVAKVFFCCVLFYLNFQLSAGAPSENGDVTEVSDLATDLENWMANLPQTLKRVSIKNLAIPGSHDSFTVDISGNSDVSPDGEEILRILGKLKTAKLVIANWSKTQAFKVIGQLQAGIRFFDLRICRNSDDGNLYFCHAMYSTEVQSVLNDMNSYLGSHSQEIVILDCQHFYNFTGETHNTVIEMLKNTFGSKLIPYQSNMDGLTLEYLTSQNKQVLVVYRDGSQSGQNLLWPSGSFPTPWYDTMDKSQLITNLNNGINSRSSSTGYISQLILTPGVNDILGGLFTTLKQKCAVDFEKDRTNWISAQTPGDRGVNVVIGDFIDLSSNLFSQTVINLNTKTLELLKNESGFLGGVRWFMRKISNFF